MAHPGTYINIARYDVSSYTGKGLGLPLYRSSVTREWLRAGALSPYNLTLNKIASAGLWSPAKRCGLVSWTFKRSPKKPTIFWKASNPVNFQYNNPMPFDELQKLGLTGARQPILTAVILSCAIQKMMHSTRAWNLAKGRNAEIKFVFL